MEGETIERTTFSVPDIDDGDRDRILDALSGVNGVRDVQVQPDSHTVEVSYDPREVSLPLLQEALTNEGYKVGETPAGPLNTSHDTIDDTLT